MEPGFRDASTTQIRSAHPRRRVHLNLDVRIAWPQGSELVRAYLSGDERAARFYAGGFFDRLDSYRSVAAGVDRRFGERERRALLPILRGRAAGDADRLDAFVRDGGYVVTTGQQAGLLTGPAYTVYKALTAITLAERLERSLEKPVLPVFWIASEDHDWEEASHAFLLDRANELRRIDAVAAEPPGDRSVFEIPLAPPDALLDALDDVLIPNDYRDDCLEWIRTAYTSGASLGDGFESLMDRFLGERGLLLVRAEDPTIKDLSADVLLGSIAEAEAQERALHRRAQELEAAGFHVQVPILDGGLQVFESGANGRARLFRSDGGVQAGPDGMAEPTAEVLGRLAREPGRFSPNALLRPVAEAAAMPVIAYVAGPGEMAYYAQNSPLYDHLGVTMPVVFPRAQAILVEAKVRKVLTKYGLTVEELETPVHELTTRLARDEMPPAVRTSLRAIRAAIGSGSGELLATIKDIDPTLSGPVSHARNQSLYAFEEAEKKIVAAIKRANDTLTQQLEKARANLYPGGSPQDRVLNVFHFLARYGPDVLGHVAGHVERHVQAPE